MLAATEVLLEREGELEAIAALVDAAAAGSGGLIVLEGPAGVGKSALLRRAAGLARERGLAVLRARGHELERAFGWGVARSLLEGCVAARPEAERAELLAGPAAPARAVFGAGEPGPQDGFAILHALYWLAVRLAEREPLALVVDDAQWADEASLRFLVYLAGRLAEQPIALLAGARAGEPDEGGLLERLAEEPAQLRPLPSLGAASVTRLVGERMAGADETL